MELIGAIIINILAIQYTTEDCVFVNASYVDDNYTVIDNNRAGVLVEI